MKKTGKFSLRILMLAAAVACADLLAPAFAYAEESTENVEYQQGLEENSFRYSDGEWIYQNHDVSMMAEEDSEQTEESESEEDKIIPWIYEDGYWRNDRGEPIPAAVEKGIDVSWHNREIDWEKVKETDVSYAVIRCGYGNDQEDQDDSFWKYNADECTRLGIPFGTYIYSYALDVEEAKSEAAHVLRLVDGYNLSFPIFYDLEDENYTGSLSAEEIGDIAETFVDEMSKAGYEVVIYSSKYWFDNVLTDERFDQWDKWVAQYNYRCTYNGEYIMWQCASDGKVDGIEGNVDINFTIDPSKIEFPPETESESESESENETEKEPAPVVPTPIEDPVGDFVIRLYRLILNRTPDANGLRDWKNRLLNQEESGAEVAWGFVMSQEFNGRNLSNDQFVEVLYETCFDRASDVSGKEYWLDNLKQGFSREYVLKGFVESEEFGNLCESFDIMRGNIELTNIMDCNPNITRFVYRNYTEFLGRRPDGSGHLDWVTKLVNKEKTPKDVAYGFVFSKELTDKKLTNAQYVTVLYKGLFDREPDSAGYNEWVRKLNNGSSRVQVFEGFAGSQEFKNLVRSFGL